MPRPFTLYMTPAVHHTFDRFTLRLSRRARATETWAHRIVWSKRQPYEFVGRRTPQSVYLQRSTRRVRSPFGPSLATQRSMTLSLAGNTVLRKLIRRNLVTFPAQARSYSKRAEGDLAPRLAQLYFIRGWSIRAICAKYGLRKSACQKLLAEWRIRAVGSGYIQEIEPGSVAAFFPELNDVANHEERDEARDEAAAADRSKVASATRFPVDEFPRTQYPGRLLIVYHDVRTKRMLHAAFNSLGFNTDEASTGEEAFALCRYVPYNAVLLDINVHGKSGIEVCRELRASKPLMPIMMLSDNDDQERNILSLEAGADDYVTRPFHLGELAARVRAALRHSRAVGSRREAIPEDKFRPADMRLVVTPEQTRYAESDEIRLVQLSRPRIREVRLDQALAYSVANGHPIQFPLLRSSIFRANLAVDLHTHR